MGSDVSLQPDEVDAFFSAFDAAFATFDGSVIAERYAEPYLACRADGSALLLADRAETGRYFQEIVDEYAQLGVRTCSHREVEQTPVGLAHLLASVTWDLLDDAGSTVIAWRESYVLVGSHGQLLIRSSVDHAPVE